MSKWNSVVKCAELRSLLREKEYPKALALVDEMDISRIKHIPDLRIIAEVYIKNEAYEEARDIYLDLYHTVPTRRMLYQIVRLSAKCNNMEDAEKYYADFYEKYKESPDCLILRYCIEKEKGTDRKILISYLEELKRQEFSERWGYELAKQYHKAHMGEECVRECEDLILWFGEGIIVEKAILLKMYYTEGIDISSEKAIEATKDLDSALKIASTIAEQRHRAKEIQKKNDAEVERLRQIRQEVGELVAQQEEEIIYNHEESWLQKEADRLQKEVQSMVRDTDELEQEVMEPFIEETEMEELQPVEQALRESVEEMIQETIYNSDIIADEQVERRTVEQLEERIAQQQEVTEPVEEADGSAEVDIIKKLRSKAGENAIEKKDTVKKEKSSVKTDVLKGNMLSKPVREEQVKKTEVKEELKEEKTERIEESGFYEIAQLVEQIKDAPSVHFAVLCNDDDEILKVSRDLAKQLHQHNMITQNVVAKTDAIALNSVHLEDQIAQLGGGCLLIMRAGEVSLKTVQSLYQIMRKHKNQISIILADTEDRLNELFEKHRKLKKLIPYKFRLMSKKG